MNFFLFIFIFNLSRTASFCYALGPRVYNVRRASQIITPTLRTITIKTGDKCKKFMKKVNSKLECTEDNVFILSPLHELLPLDI